MATGYEQVRSIVAALAGDWSAADDLRLVLPETGVCSGGGSGESCCGGALRQRRVLLRARRGGEARPRLRLRLPRGGMMGALQARLRPEPLGPGATFRKTVEEVAK